MHLQPGQLTAWERAGLISRREQYSFNDLTLLRTVRSLRTMRMTARNIRVSVEAMQRTGMRNPLTEATAVRRGTRLTFRHNGTLVDPVTSQLAFDFGVSPSTELGMGRPGLAPVQAMADVQGMFLRAVAFEEDKATVPQAMVLYREILALRPRHASASINLGTIHYNLREFPEAERL